ncbi:MAG: nucleotide exchange factor GrpE [Chthoniobacterales bacterium]
MATKGNIELPAEFASAMQQLVAEAAKNGNADTVRNGDSDSDAPEPQETHSTDALAARLDTIEKMLAEGFAKLSTPPPPAEGPDLAAQLRKIDEHLTALRNTESVNHRLFNTLHQELKTYRDNFLRESLQKPFIRDLIVLFDDLSSLSGQMQNAAASNDARPVKLGQWTDNLSNALHSLIEIMNRMEVSEIEPKDKVDRTLHKVVSYEPADFAEEDGHIMMRLRRGFTWREQVLRPEEVVAKRFE